MTRSTGAGHPRADRAARLARRAGAAAPARSTSSSWSSCKARPRPELLPDLAVGEGDIFYDKATDRLKVVVHNLGAAAAENVTVRFEDPQGNLLGQR